MVHSVRSITWPLPTLGKVGSLLLFWILGLVLTIYSINNSPLGLMLVLPHKVWRALAYIPRMILLLVSTVLKNVPHHGRGRFRILIGQINWGEPCFPPTATHHYWPVRSGSISEKNPRFAIELILFLSYIQILVLSQLGLIIHLRPLILPPETHDSWIRATSILSASSFLHISAEAALLSCKLICITLMISFIGA
jgi:hypothetical protein